MTLSLSFALSSAVCALAWLLRPRPLPQSLSGHPELYKLFGLESIPEIETLQALPRAEAGVALGGPPAGTGFGTPVGVALKPPRLRGSVRWV